MKKILFAILMCLPMTMTAQNTWEIQKNENGVAANPDAKYLTGAVPVADGKVVFETTIEAPGTDLPDTTQVSQRHDKRRESV